MTSAPATRFRPFVGRDRELAELVAALDDASRGSARLVLLRGDPGMGKSRLCEEALANARSRGFLTALGPCWETPGAPPYWPWLQLLDALADASPVDGSELRALLSGSDNRLAPEARRFQVSQAAVRTLRQAAQRPLLLVFEDLHAADLPSLELLQVAVRGLKQASILWLLTSRWRDARLTDDLQGALSRLAREGLLLTPSPLEPGSVARMAEAYLGRPLPADVVERVAQSTEGTPLFVEGTLRLIDAHAAAQRGPTPGANPLPLPQSAHDVLRDRLALLPGGSREALELAAVIGRTFSRQMLSLATGQTERELDALLAPAVDAGVLTEASTDALAFSHALLREALYEQLPARRKAELHLRIFGALRATGADALELAHHALAAWPHSPEAETLALVREAAQKAERMLAFHRAAELYERALSVVAVRRPSSAYADLLLALSAAQANAGQASLAIETAERAAAEARALADAERLARAALASGAVFRLGQIDRSLVALLEEAIRALGASAPALTVILRARLASALQPAEDPRVPVRLARQAIEAARRLGPDTLKTALHFGLSAMGDVTDAPEREPLLVELVALARASGEKALEHRAQARLAMALYEQGELGRAEQCVAELEALGQELGPGWRLRPLLFRSMRALMEGRFVEADRLAAELERTYELSDSAEFRATLEMHRMFGRLARAQHPEVLASIEPLMDLMRGTSMELQRADCILAASLSAQAGDAPRAAQYLARLPDQTFLSPDRGLAFAAAMAAGMTGDRHRAELLERLLTEVRQPMSGQGLIGMSLDGPFDWARGWLAAARGRVGDALELFTRALEQARQLGARAVAVRILRDRAMLGGDAADAAALAGEVQALGLHALALPQRGPMAPASTSAPTPEAESASATTSAAASAVPGPASASLSRPPALVRDGEGWRLHAYGQELWLKDSRGVSMLAALLERPGRDMHVLELSGSDATAEGDAGEVLDAKAKAQYRARMESLREEQEEAERFNDPGRAERAREELEFLAGELSAGVGLGGRARRAASNAERARSNVQRRLKDALAKIEELAPSVGRRLGRSVKTGLLCRFDPE